MPIDNKELYDAMGKELQRSATPNESRLERLIDAVDRLDERAAQIGDAISDLEHTIAGATVAIVAGMLYAAASGNNPNDPGHTYSDAAKNARHIIEEVGNGGK